MVKEVDPNLLRRLSKLVSTGSKTRAELVKETGLPRTTIYDNLQRIGVKSKPKRQQARSNQSRQNVKQPQGRPKTLFYK